MSATYNELTELANITLIEVSPQKRTDGAFEHRHDWKVLRKRSGMKDVNAVERKGSRGIGRQGGVKYFVKRAVVFQNSR